ncbi:hypothetical protein Q4488_05915 [Amphritea sp. 1_MG-2023]|uniref:hypothetical protein n=1 Tax=Amphritea sp. 1_MG-2023 TaxID=3062670 RepID=UPI0026E20C87|nr:hypothetical protein [Amphritea sp. 1_MG-2023]MDO6562917.1 hypothetical protein [Amphritea sp. 1_MG-2023]
MNRFVAIQALALSVLTVSFAVMADRKEDLIDPIDYEVIQAAGHIDSPVDPESVYRYRRRGFVDSEPMIEIKPYSIAERQLPPPTVVPYSEPAPVERVISAQQSIAPLTGEDKIFAQIARDQLEIECTLDDSLSQCEGIEIEQPKEHKPRSRRVIDRQIQTSGTN